MRIEKCPFVITLNVKVVGVKFTGTFAGTIAVAIYRVDVNAEVIA